MNDYQKYILILVLIFVFYFFGNRYGKLIAANDYKDEKKDNEQSSEFGFSESKINKSRLTYPEEQYKSYAIRLKNAFGIVDDEETIYDVFRQMHTSEDVQMLILKYGTPIDTPNYNIFIPNMVVNIKRKNLIEVIHSHLNNKEIAKINEILRKRNINYRF